MSAASMLDPEADILGMRPAEFYRLVQTDVERELEQRLPRHIDNESLLDIYTRWLVFQIPNLGHLSHEHSSETIQRGCDYLTSRNYNKGLVLSAFSRHKDLYIREHPQATRSRSDLAVILIRTVLLVRLVATTLTALMTCIVPARPVVQFTIMNQVVRTNRRTRTGVSHRTIQMTHHMMRLQIAVTGWIIANLQVAGMSHAMASHQLAPMNHAEPLIRIILTDRSVVRKRSDGRLSPWDDIHPPAKKPRRQDTLEGGLPRDDIETSRKKSQEDFADSPTPKQVSVVDTEPASTVDSKKAVSSAGVAKERGDSTDAEWEQAGTEADAFLQALGRELVECPEIEASAGSRDEGSSDIPTYSPASPVSSVDQHHPPEDLAPGDGEDFPMADVLDDIAERTRSMSLEIDEDQPRSDPVIVPFYTLKSLQRDPPYDSGVLNLFRLKKNSHVYINVTRRRKAIDFYNETEEERATMNMSHCSLTTSRSSGSC
ncbi:hypothetical protein LZ30DRAFT_755938 [Colletotrichum cereale]|nr:hypothetical protein LZ30DRAFT_755938 [Colletotrichum cereale]